MIDRDTEIVSSIRAALKTRLGVDRYELWLGAATRISVQPSCVCIAASNGFRLDRVRKGLLAEIQAVARELIGPEATVEFDVDATLAVSAAEQPATGPCRMQKPRGDGGACRDDDAVDDQSHHLSIAIETSRSPLRQA